MKRFEIYCLLIIVFFLLFSSCQNRQTKYANPDEQQLFIGEDIAIASTQYGKVQGFILRDIFQYRGIPYGEDTGGENRFMPPKPPEIWNDTLQTIWWGNTAPQIMNNRYANPFYSFTDSWNYDDVSEDCLRLNIWTPNIDAKKRPVLIWLHGGGYRNGNAIEQDGYKGENISRKGDIVFVSINHRLGPLGFSDFSSVGGEAYKHSGNVGVLDMIFALEWVQQNIENFGGDPNNVTVMGHSGGGAKVCNMLASPLAQGKFHKAVPLSGSSIQSMNQDYTQKVGECILEVAGLKASEIDQLQQIPWPEYLNLAYEAEKRCAEENAEQKNTYRSFGPVADGEVLPKGPYFTDPNGPGSEIPMLICTTFHEWNRGLIHSNPEDMSMEEMKDRLSKMGGRRAEFGDQAAAIVDAYAAAFPDQTPAELMALIVSNRKEVVATANAKANQPANVYMAWFGWEPPHFDERLRAFHCLDISFWFYNTDLMLTHTAGGERPRILSEKMSDALLNFMRSGDPNGSALPEWPPYTIENGETMLLNDQSEVQNDPDREARKTLN